MIVQILIFLLVIVYHNSSQELKKAVIVTKKDNTVSTEQVYFGYLNGCDSENGTEDELKKMNIKIAALENSITSMIHEISIIKGGWTPSTEQITCIFP